MGHIEEGGDGETGYGLEGWDGREACGRGHVQTQAQSQSLFGERLLPAGPVLLVWPPVLLAETCLHPPGGRGGGRVQRVGLTGVVIR